MLSKRKPEQKQRKRRPLCCDDAAIELLPFGVLVTIFSFLGWCNATYVVLRLTTKRWDMSKFFKCFSFCAKSKCLVRMRYLPFHSLRLLSLPLDSFDFSILNAMNDLQHLEIDRLLIGRMNSSVKFPPTLTKLVIGDSDAPEFMFCCPKLTELTRAFSKLEFVSFQSL